jgi:hypothetical protein
LEYGKTAAYTFSFAYAGYWLPARVSWWHNKMEKMWKLIIWKSSFNVFFKVYRQ